MKTKMKGKTMRCSIICATIVATVLSGCIAIPGKVTDMSKPMEQGKYQKVGDTVASSVYNVSIFGIPLPPIFSDSNSTDEMINNTIHSAQGRLLYHKALEKAPGADALIEYSLDYQFFFCLIGSVTRGTLSGTPVKTTVK